METVGLIVKKKRLEAEGEFGAEMVSESIEFSNRSLKAANWR